MVVLTRFHVAGFIYLLTLLEGMLTIESVALVMSIPVIRRSVNLSQDLHVRFF